jgi:hypothetical protein
MTFVRNRHEHWLVGQERNSHQHLGGQESSHEKPEHKGLCRAGVLSPTRAMVGTVHELPPEIELVFDRPRGGDECRQYEHTFTQTGVP